MIETDRFLIRLCVCLVETLGGVSPDGRVAVVGWRQDHHVILCVLLHEVHHTFTAHGRIAIETVTHNHITP